MKAVLQARTRGHEHTAAGPAWGRARCSDTPFDAPAAVRSAGIGLIVQEPEATELPVILASTFREAPEPPPSTGRRASADPQIPPLTRTCTGRAPRTGRGLGVRVGHAWEAPHMATT